MTLLCIWDGWFVDENRKCCYGPPTNDKIYLIRVLSKEKPDDSWDICECSVVSEGHVTYNSCFEIVKEKCAAKFNTSSADEQEAILMRYRRKHPVLSSTRAESFEHLFTKKKQNAGAVQKKPRKKQYLPSRNCEISKNEKTRKQNQTILGTDETSSAHKLAPKPSQSLSQRSRSTSAKESTPPPSNRSFSPRGSRSSTRQGSVTSTNHYESRSHPSSRFRSNSSSRSRSNSSSRSRSNSSRRSRSNLRSKSPSGSLSSRQGSILSRRDSYSPPKSHNSKSRSRSNSGASYQSQMRARHSPRFNAMQFVRGVSPHSNVQ